MDEMFLVVRPFHSLELGSLITNRDDIENLLHGEHVHYVVRVAAPTCDKAESKDN